jgi:vacuolar-type H+-ATPase subunit D/Vma8
MQLASFSLAEVTYTAGDIAYQVQESVRKASYTVQARQENVSGVVLPAFEGVRSKDASGECGARCAVRGARRATSDEEGDQPGARCVDGEMRPGRGAAVL